MQPVLDTDTNYRAQMQSRPQ